MGRAFLARAEDVSGFPALDFERFYQQGLSCFAWRLPRRLVRNAFKRLCEQWKCAGKRVETWQVRAFVDGLHGNCNAGHGMGLRHAAASYQWPVPPDPSWSLVVCVYPDGECELDMVHEVSRRFWSEDNGFIQLPSDNTCLINQKWFDQMGFDVIVMYPEMTVIEGNLKRPLNLV